MELNELDREFIVSQIRDGYTSGFLNNRSWSLDFNTDYEEEEECFELPLFNELPLLQSINQY